MTETAITRFCTGVCAYDPADGWRLGCGRTRAEIGGWGDAQEADHAAIWAAPPDRLSSLVRTDDATLIARLRTLLGADLPTMLREAGAALVAASPVRLVETTLARADVSAPIPAPGERPPVGCHTHLLPGAPALRRETLPRLDLPEVYAPAAVFYTAALAHGQP
ncbi:DUF1289 domain-containing protein [Rubrimonas cliftonensis]|uniref:Predicted Fe-S protein YdhL, DUF1289 family n=1 Tax=Rubrimonas cliftonensis TaxID=89524 RepID=A0A1H4G8M6_9RHOB|nr:DUF1289 domain-containing protein [Rubrimonas cliftonensis]SEB05975.1 Predicted Fe-S protein YdhL, DUF1289 family [Rubrimonas cliftonensis]